MAAPVYISTTTSTTTTWSTTHTITLPTSVANNHLVMSFCSNGSGGSISGPSGWTQVLSIDLNANQKWRVWIKQCTGTEGTTATVTTSLQNVSATQVLRFNSVRLGVAQGTTWDVAYTSSTGYGTTIDPPSCTATWGATTNLFIAMLAAASTGPSVSAYPSGYSNGASTTSQALVATATLSSSSATDDPAVYTITSSNNYRAATLVLRGAADVSAGAQVATGTGTGRQPTITPPTTSVSAGHATGTGTAYYVRVPRRQVASDVVVEWDFDNDGDFDESVEDITSYVLTGSVRRGRDYPSQVTGRSRPGHMEFILNNSDNRFNYFNASSPLTTAPFSLNTGRLIRVRTSTATVDDPVPLARDRFATNGALATDELGNTWLTPSGFTGFAVTNKRAIADGAASSSGALYGNTIDVNTTTYYAQAVVPYKDATNRLGLIFHYTDASNYGYLYMGDGVIYLVEVSGGTHTTKASDGLENRDDIAVGLAVNGTSVKAYIDGVEVLSATMGISATDKVGIYGRWYYQRAPLFSEFMVWDRARRTQSWDTTPSGVLGTMRVTKIVPRIDDRGVKTAVVTAAGDLGLLDRPIEAPASTGPDPVQSFGSKAGQLIGNALHKAGVLHPPGPLEGGDITLGAVGMDRQAAISIVRKLESTEAGFVYELPEGGIGFERRTARNSSSIVATFSDNVERLGLRYERLALRDWQGDVINDVTSEVSGRLTRYTVVTSRNNFTGFGVANDVTFTLPSAVEGLSAGDLMVVAVSKTVWTANVPWIVPPGWTPIRNPGSEKGQMAVFAKKATASDIGASVSFYDDTTPAGGSWTAIIFIMANWLGSIASGVTVSEPVGYGPTSLTVAQSGTVDLPVLFPPWGSAAPTLFIALRTGMHTASAAATVTTSGDDAAPDGFDSMGSVHINPTGFGQEVLHAAIQWARRIRSQAVLNTNGFGGTFTGFSYTEGLVLGIRGGFDGFIPSSGTGGYQVNDRTADDQIDRGGAVLSHPDPGLFFEDVTAARDYNHHILSRYGADRPILSIGYTATRDKLHRDYAASVKLSDRNRIEANDEAGMGINADFFVETITHRFSQGTAIWELDLDLSPSTDGGLGADGYVSQRAAEATAASSTGSAHQATVNVSSAAAPTVVSVTTSRTNTPATSHTVTMPGTTASGNLLLVTLMFNSDCTVTGPGGGWTKLSGSSASPGQSEVWAKIATGSDGASLSFSTSSTQAGAFQVIRISGNKGGIVSGTDYNLSISSAATTANPNPPSVTASWGAANNLFIVVAHTRGNNSTVSAYPTNYSSGSNIVTTNGGGGGASSGIAFRSLAAASDDPATFTLSGSEYGYAYTIVVRPT